MTDLSERELRSPKLRKAQEIIEDMRKSGATGPFEVLDEEDEFGNPTGNVKVIDHGKRRHDAWVV